jgi:hypothetical protein
LLFEEPDGTPHIIGNNNKRNVPGQLWMDLERFRQAIDTAITTDLRDQDTKSHP